MPFIFTLLEEIEAREICSWRYSEPYDVYNHRDPEDGLTEMLDRRSPYYAVRDEQSELVGFFCYGTSAQVWGNAMPALYSEDMIIDIGLGMRPDLTGKGIGQAFVSAGLAFAKTYFRPQSFRLFVLSFNERAIRVYERAGFVRTDLLTRLNEQREFVFVEMRRSASGQHSI